MDISNKKTRAYLKDRFKKNAIPTETDFADLIEAALNQKDDGVARPSGEPLSIQALPTSGRPVLRLYQAFDKPADWVIGIGDGSAAEKPSLVISNGAGKPMLSIDQATGELRVGSTVVKGTLTVDSLTVGAVTASGHVTANAGLTVPAGQATSVGALTAVTVTAGAITASGLITANAGLKVAAGKALTVGTRNVITEIDALAARVSKLEQKSKDTKETKDSKETKDTKEKDKEGKESVKDVKDKNDDKDELQDKNDQDKSDIKDKLDQDKNDIKDKNDIEDKNDVDKLKDVPDPGKLEVKDKGTHGIEMMPRPRASRAPSSVAGAELLEQRIARLEALLAEPDRTFITPDERPHVGPRPPDGQSTRTP